MRAILCSLVLLGTACGKKKAEEPTVTCAQVTDRMVQIMSSGPTAHGAIAMGNRDQLIATCEKRKLSQAQRKCMVEAKDVVALANCSAPPSASPQPTAPAGPVTTPPPPSPGSGTESAAGSGAGSSTGSGAGSAAP